MSNERQRKIDWPASLKSFVLGFWTIVTYLALMTGCFWLALSTGEGKPALVGAGAVWYTAALHWLMFLFLEYRWTKN